jgi:hypothetical protein
MSLRLMNQRAATRACESSGTYPWMFFSALTQEVLGVFLCPRRLDAATGRFPTHPLKKTALSTDVSLSSAFVRVVDRSAKLSRNL